MCAVFQVFDFTNIAISRDNIVPRMFDFVFANALRNFVLAVFANEYSNERTKRGPSVQTLRSNL